MYYTRYQINPTYEDTLEYFQKYVSEIQSRFNNLSNSLDNIKDYSPITYDCYYNGNPSTYNKFGLLIHLESINDELAFIERFFTGHGIPKNWKKYTTREQWFDNNRYLDDRFELQLNMINNSLSHLELLLNKVKEDPRNICRIIPDVVNTAEILNYASNILYHREIATGEDLLAKIRAEQMDHDLL